jgi:hypothetical protein
MGQRRHQRVKMVLPIRVSGRDADGKEFSQLSHTLELSRSGARLGGVQARLNVGDEITVEYKRARGRFTVRWVSDKTRQVGVENADPEKFTFIELPGGSYVDEVDESAVRARVREAKAAPIEAAVVAPPPPGPPGERVEPATEKGVPENTPAVVQPVTASTKLDDLKRKLRETKSEADDGLQLVAAAARELLPAGGAAIAVVGGEDWVCRASSGIAPRVGVRFQAPQGLTGHAAVSGKVVICRDTEEDRLVNSSVWRSVQLRSAASVPIMHNADALGVLEVFAEPPNAFGEEHETLLLELGELLAELIVASSVGTK